MLRVGMDGDIVCLLCDVRARPNNVADVDAAAVSKDGITSPLHLACEGGYNIVSNYWHSQQP